MSSYDEEKKQQVAEDIESWLLRNTHLRERDITIHLQKDWESYVTIEIEPSETDNFPGWDSEQVRNMTDLHIDFIDIQGPILSVGPA